MMYLLLIAMFMALFLRDVVGPPLLGEVPPQWSAATTLALLGTVWATGHALVWRQSRRLDRTGRMSVLHRADRIVAGVRIGIVLMHAFAVLGLGWLDAVRSVTGNIVAVDELLAVLPGVTVLAMTWWSIYPMERRLREAALIHWVESGDSVQDRAAPRVPGRWAFVLGGVRHNIAVVLLPVSLILTWNEALESSTRLVSAPALLVALQFAGIGVVLTLMPAVMRRVWDTAAMAPGPLREQISAMCRLHRVRIRELLVWRTHGTMVNGAVMGIAWPFRYILLTDALIDQLHPRQIEAVTAHEVGHVRRRHMPWLLAGMGGTLVVTMYLLQEALWRTIGPWVGQDAVVGAAAIGSLVIGALAFGLASRRFEWQADAFAVQHLSGSAAGREGSDPMLVTAEAAHAMSSALDAVAHLNHIRRDRFTWRHGSIASRQRRLAALVGKRADRLWADREAGIVKIVSGAAFAGAAALLALAALASPGA